MHRVTQFLLAAPLMVACSAPASVVVEVLPPRTSATCAAPAKTDPALGRGLFDVLTTVAAHGGYVGDLRLTRTGEDARITGLDIAYAFSSEDGGIDDAIGDASGAVTVGDVFLVGKDDDNRVGVLENVPLVPRELAVAIEEANVGLSKIEFQQLNLEIKAEVDGVLADDVSTFTLDVCEGCLTLPPDACSDAGENALNPFVCRAGQDVPLFLCTAAAAP
jgi:hypothetical protein